MTLDAKLEALLFFKAEPLSVASLAKIFTTDEVSVVEALQSLKNNLVGRGITLVEKDGEVSLGTSPDVSELIEKITRDELKKDIGRAGLETLTVILYRGPITRSGIDYIRGVNSTFILRNLMVRGLVEKIPNPEDQRSFLYRPTFDLLSYLSISRIDELPEYGAANLSLNEFDKVLNEEGDVKEDKHEESEQQLN